MNNITTNLLNDITSLNIPAGYANGSLLEPDNSVVYDYTEAEVIYPDSAPKHNTFIVFGRDRPGNRESGYGGKGHHKCGTIDIVAGRLSNIDATTLTGPVSPSTGGDAARIYVSQKTDVDDNYFLCNGITGNSKAMSAVVMKADDIRIISRNTLKIVTKTDDKLSNGELAYNLVGVQLIANNDDSDMQPMALGHNLVDAFEGLTKKIEELNSLVFGFMEIQRDFNVEITKHTHLSPFFGLKTSPSEEVLPAGGKAGLQMFLKIEQGLKNNLFNINTWRSDFLLTSSKKYINSVYHYLN